MLGNSFGQLFRITTFGESHGPALGVVIDGCPAGVDFDQELLRSETERRRPGTSVSVSSRNEQDRPQILSGVFEGKTLGTPIAIAVQNQDARPQDYREIDKHPRQGHADDVWKDKFVHVDPRGGGRSSGRETVARVMGGAVAKMLLKQLSPGFSIETKLLRVGELVCCCSPQILAAEVVSLLEVAKHEGESYGAELGFEILGVTSGLGQPVFHKLKADLGAAVLGIGAVNGVQFGNGFQAAAMRGTEFHAPKNSSYGGIRGGISTGEAIQLSVSFKPPSSILEVAKGGRHDPCIGIRGSVVVEAMIALVIADHIMLKRLDNL